MLATTGSREITEWILELGRLRPEDENRAMDKAKKESESGEFGMMGS